MYTGRQYKNEVGNKVSRQVECGMRQLVKVRDERNTNKEVCFSNTLQRRIIIGHIYVSGKGGFEHLGRTNPQGTQISNLFYGPLEEKRIMDPSQFDRINIKGHLIKALWDNGNEEYRIAQWHEGHERTWTAFETEVEGVANQYRGPKKGRTEEWTIRTETDDPNIGDRLLGSDYKDAKLRLNGITLPQYNRAKAVLNRQISTATMYLNNKFIGAIVCPDISNDLRLNPSR